MCTRLSILAPRPMRVTSSAPRSIVALAPISTSSRDFEAPHLRKFFVVSRRPVADVAEAISTQHSSGMNDHAITDPSSRINSHIGINFAIASDRNAGADHSAGADPGAIANFRLLADDGPFRHAGIFAESRRGVNNRAGMRSLAGDPVPNTEVCRPEQTPAWDSSRSAAVWPAFPFEDSVLRQTHRRL